MVFAPYRRGYTERYSDNDPAHDNHPYIINNSGTYVGDYIDRFHTLDDQRRGEVWYLKDEVRDVQAALTFMTTFSLTNVTNNDSVRMNKKLVYMLGRSFGGIVTMFAAAANLVPLPNAVVTISGAAESMTLDDHPANQGLNPYYKEVLPAALYGRRMPIFFAQPANEASLLPTTFLPTFAAISSLHLMEAGTFPPVLPDPNECQHTPANCDANGSLIPNEIHTRFTSSYQHVKDWGPAILAFFELYQ
jgi:hypothetical protein